MAWLLLVILAFFVSLLPMKLAAMIVGAHRTGFGWCFLATVVAGGLHAVGLLFPGPGNLFSVLLAAAGYSAILRTSYAGGLAVTVLQFIIAAGLAVMIAVILGIPYAIPRPLPIVL